MKEARPSQNFMRLRYVACPSLAACLYGTNDAMHSTKYNHDTNNRQSSLRRRNSFIETSELALADKARRGSSFERAVEVAMRENDTVPVYFAIHCRQASSQLLCHVPGEPPWYSFLLLGRTLRLTSNHRKPILLVNRSQPTRQLSSSPTRHSDKTHCNDAQN